jgi:hypothetical protein
MLTAAVVCPGPPLLVPELSGADPAAAELRTAGITAVQAMLASFPDTVAVVGPAQRSQSWPPDARAGLGAYGRSGSGAGAPLSVGLGAWLLDQAQCETDRLMWSVGAADWNAAAAALAQIPGRLGLLVIADGSARRTVKAPGYIDDRAGPYDESVRVAVSSGDLAALRDLDPDLARQLMAPGWPALQVLAELAGDDRPHATVHYCDAPFGVGYLVATLLFDG